MEPISGMLNYPQVKQVFRIIRHRHTLTTGVDSSEVAYGITSLSPEQAHAQRLLAFNRGHWTIENLNHRFHRFRDTTFAEDAGLMHTGRPTTPSSTTARSLSSSTAAATRSPLRSRNLLWTAAKRSGRLLNPADRAAPSDPELSNCREPPGSAPSTPAPDRRSAVTAGTRCVRPQLAPLRRSTSSQDHQLCGTDAIERLDHRVEPFVPSGFDRVR